MSKRWKIVGIEFSHMHMGDLLRNVCDHPDAEIVGVCDPQAHKMQAAIDALSISPDKVFTDYRQCLEQTKPDLVILCPPTDEHALWVERVAPYDAHVFVEKPFAASLEDADRMMAAVEKTNRQLIINWPLRWVTSHVTTHRLIREGMIGDVTEVHYYDGNRGPLYHGADKIELEPTAEEKRRSWWYQKDAGGGSLNDYLGYGVTLGTWFNGGKKPIEITAATHATPGLEVDEHAIVIARYEHALSKFETRWGTFSDPWTHQPQPKCGFVVRGTAGTISSYDYESTLRIQTAKHPEGVDHPVDELPEGERNGVEYTIKNLENNTPVDGPLAPHISRIGQQIVDTAIQSAQQKRTLPLVDR